MTNSNEITKINQLIADAEQLKKRITLKIQDFTSFLRKNNKYSNLKGHMSECINSLENIQRSI